MTSTLGVATESGGKTKPSWPRRVGGFRLRSRLGRSSPHPTARGAEGEAWGPLVAHPGVSASREALKLECSGCVSSPGGRAPRKWPVCFQSGAPVPGSRPLPSAGCSQAVGDRLACRGGHAGLGARALRVGCGQGAPLPSSNLGRCQWNERVAPRPRRAGCSPPCPCAGDQVCSSPGSRQGSQHTARLGGSRAVGLDD